MPLRDRTYFLTTAGQVDEFLKGNPNAVLFKAGTCHKTQETFRRIQTRLEKREDLALGIIRVVEGRPASDRVVEVTGIAHESPQFVLFRDGKAVYDVDNWDITGEAVAEALQEHFTPA